MPLSQQNHIFIDPESCGSSVGYYLHVNEYTDREKKTTYTLYGNVVLTDCNHKIDWSFGGSNSEDSLAKIDAAIRLLQEFRKKYADAEKMVQRLNK